MTPRALFTLLGMLALGGLSGCSNNPTRAALGTMNIQMTDAPGDFQAVNLVVNEVAAHPSTGDGWEILASQPHTYDLLQLRNGVFTTLGLSPLPAGHYDELRLKLGAGSTVVVNNLRHPLVVPSGLQSGYKLVGSFEVPENGRIDLGLDFDVSRSIVLTGNGQYVLNPVTRIVTLSLPDQQPGAIHGTVAPGDVATSVFVMQDADTVTSSLTAADGSFTVSLLPAGAYRLVFHPWHDFQDQTMDGVAVQMGVTTDIGTVQLVALPPTQGTIAGQVSPAGVTTTVMAVQGGSTVAQAGVDANGNFLLGGLPAGTYSVQFQPDGGYLSQTVDGVAVTAGATTQLGVIQLQPPAPPATGAVAGQVVPFGVPTTVTAMQGGVVMGQTAVDFDGMFTIDALLPGTYTLQFHPEYDFPDSMLEGVVVSSGTTTNVGLVSLQF